MNFNKDKVSGITLIALVITIIVLLILAGVSIAMLTGDNGILNQASKATKETERAEAKELAQMDIAAYQSDKMQKGENAELNDIIVKEILTGKDYVLEAKDTSFISKKGEHEILYSELYNKSSGVGQEVEKPESWPDNDEITAITDGEENIIPLPKDFYYVGGTKDEGIVISDKPNDDMENTAGGNQFVWVPVDNYEDFQRQDIDELKYGEANSQGRNEYLESLEMQETETTRQEAIKMYESVKNYNGFYIGRFETGIEEENVVVKKGVTPYELLWSATSTVNEEEDLDGTQEGAIEQARYFAIAKNYTSVKSLLCYSVQWDALFNFIDPDYITNAQIGDSNCQENSYLMKTVYQNYELENNNTGYEQIKNVYDIIYRSEWSMEITESSYGEPIRVERGQYTVKDRDTSNYIDSAYRNFRITLCL